MIMVGYLSRVLALACSFVAARTYAVVAFVRPWLWTAQSGRHLAIFDALLIARLAAQPLFGGSRRLGLDLVPSARDPSDICATRIIAISGTGARTFVEDNISASVQQQSGHCCRF
jgi:hypothetical protein